MITFLQDMPTPRHGQIRRQRRVIEVEGESVGYELYEFDARRDEECSADDRRQALGGDLLVIIPGHGQTADSAKHLIENTAFLSKSKVVWSVDIDPPRGGDPIKAKALLAIVRENLSALFPSSQGSPGPEMRVTLFGWSHGGAEALRTAEIAGQLIPRIAGICPAGLVDRPVLELLFSFLLESLRIVWLALTKADPTYLRRVLGMGANMIGGVLRDAMRARSLSRAWADIRWTARKVPGKDYRYDGKVALLFGGDDTVIRWRDVFSKCGSPPEIASSLEDYKRNNFACSESLEVRVLEGNHLSPETDITYARTALQLLGQRGEEDA